MERESWRVAAALVLAGVFAFLALQVAAGVAYPGGTFCDAGATHYRFWGNFVCDVMQPHSQAGVDNTRAARLGTASFAVIAAAFVPFWWLVGGALGPWARRLVRVLGVLSALATLVVARVPSARWPLLHVGAVFTASIPGLIAAIVGSAALWRAGQRLLGALGTATLLAGGINAAGYARAVVHGIRCRPWLPAVQKIAALALLAWMVAVAALGARGKLSR